MPQKTVVFVPSYCLTLDQSRLTYLSRKAVSLGDAVACFEKGSTLVLSAAYNVWEKEDQLKRKLLEEDSYTPINRVIMIGPVSDSYDEARQLAKAVGQNVWKIIVIAEKWHINRLVTAIKTQFPNSKIITNKFETRHFDFERTYEPHPNKFLGWVKSVRSGNKLLWIIWNIALEFFAPLIPMKKRESLAVEE